MKTNKKQLLNSITLGLIVVLIFFGGCKKELVSNDDQSAKLKMEDQHLNANNPRLIKEKKLRLSPSIKFKVESPITKTSYNIPKGVNKMATILKEDQAKKKDKIGATTSSVNFTATLGTGITH